MAEAQLTRFDSMTNVELRAELKRRGCPTSGNKKDLLAKLHAALQNEYEQNIQQSSLNHSVEYSQNETPVNYTNQATAQYSSVYNLTIPQNIHSSPTSMIPIPQQLSVGHQQVNTIPIIDSTPEKKTRARSKKSSVDSHLNEIPTTTSINNEQIILDNSTNNNNIEVNSFVSKSNEKKEKDIGEGGESYLPSIGINSAKSESIIKEIPLSDEQQHSETINKKQNSTIHPTQIINHSSNITDLKSITTKQQEIINESEKTISQQQFKPNRSQISSLMKGLNRSTNNKLNLSLEILKTLIPDISLVSESIINNELDSLINEQNNDIEEINLTNNFLPSHSITIGELADQKQQINRTVVMDIVKDDLIRRKKQNSIPIHVSSFESKTLLFDGKTDNIVTDEPIRIKDVTITHEPLSQILYIRGLTRPFSLLQLKGLLSRYGTLIDGEFWLDKIKSQCFVTYNTLEEAQNAREALDGCRWPLTNPKTLSIRFARQDELEFSKINDYVIQEKSNIISSNQSTSPIDEIKLKNHSDLPELQEEKQSGFLITEEEESLKTNEQTMKGLDDYFRKTKTKPSIYWLPLTEEQIIQRNHRQEQRKRNTQRSNSKSSSSQEKRKHSLSPKQDSKRH